MKILSIDLGKTSGILFKDGENKIYQEHKFISLKAFRDEVARWVKNTEPDIVICPYPTRFYRVIVFQSKLAAVIELVAEECGVQYLEVNDSNCKKVVIGKGNAKKEDIAKYYATEGIKSEHVMDALLFTDWYEIELTNNHV